jgi:hypothetical protein
VSTAPDPGAGRRRLVAALLLAGKRPELADAATLLSSERLGDERDGEA